MGKILDTFLFILILSFFAVIFHFYFSKKNIEEKNYIRNNIDEIINEKISNLPILKNNTDNVIEFNDGFSNQMQDDRPRSFWNLLKPE